VRDGSVDSLIRKIISARTQESPGRCADENTMAAYLESKLSPEERAGFEAHTAECAECQEVLALALRLQDQGTAGLRAGEQRAEKKVLFHFSVPIPVLGGIFLAVILIAVLFRVTHESGRDLQKPKTAELSVPAAQTETATLSAPMRNSSAQTETEAYNAPTRSPAAHRGTIELKKNQIAARLPKNEARENGFSGSKGEIGSVSTAAPVINARPAEPAGIAARKVADEGTHLLRGEESISRPRIYAAQNRMATISTLNMAPISTAVSTTSARDAISQLEKPANLDEAESKKIGGKVFYLNSGYWIDRQSIEHPEHPIVEIAPAAPEYRKILIQYPELRDLRPLLVHWENNNYLLRR
jgi:hypothetical protein